MRGEGEARQAIELYGDMVKRICFLHLKNNADTEDIFQAVFLKYVLYSGVFENREHEKAWFARITINACKDFLKSFYKKKVVPMEYIAEAQYRRGGGALLPEERQDDCSKVLEAVLSLPAKYRDAVYLYYYEGYSAKEIGAVLKKGENTVYTRLSRAKCLLKEMLGGEGIG